MSYLISINNKPFYILTSFNLVRNKEITKETKNLLFIFNKIKNENERLEITNLTEEQYAAIQMNQIINFGHGLNEGTLEHAIVTYIDEYCFLDNKMNEEELNNVENILKNISVSDKLKVDEFSKNFSRCLSHKEIKRIRQIINAYFVKKIK